MFNLFNRKTSKEFMEDAQKNYQVSPTPEGKQNDVCNYTVGTTESGRTALKVTSDCYTITLTLNEPAVRKLIRLLEASISETEE